jgi:hypothetical protein
VLSGLLLAACGSGEQSIALIFPNDAARLATQRIVLEAHSPDTGTASTNDRDCMSFLGAAKEGRPIQGAQVRGDYQYPFSIDQELTQVPSGRMIIYVTAYSSREDEAPPILEGCTSDFDSEGGGDDHVEVEVRLAVVLPTSARLVKAQGDRQVGREGEDLPVPLKVRVEAESPMNATSYVIPGVAVELTSNTDGFSFEGGGMQLGTFTDAKGEASVRVKLPNMSGTGMIVAVAPELDDPEKDDTERYTQQFAVSVTERVTFPSSSVIDGTGIPIAVAFGQLTGSAERELVILSCEGSARACTPGSAAMKDPNFGNTRLAVYTSLSSNVTPYPVRQPPGGLGILPASLAVTDLVGPGFITDEIAIVNSRRTDCQSRTCTPGQPCACFNPPDGACPCEGSELLILRDVNGSMELDERQTLTASNAIAVAPYVLNGGAYKNLAISAQGRSRNTQPCSLQTHCRMNQGESCENNPAACGCPAEELCECGGCSTTTEPGVCVARDKIVDLFLNRWNDDAPAGMECGPSAPNGRCANAEEICDHGTCVRRGMLPKNEGCRSPYVSCDKSDAMASSQCTCEDLNVSMCSGTDFCGCRIPDRVYVGNAHTPRYPYSITAGEIDEQDNWDIVVPSDGGLELIEARASQRTFGWTTSPTLNAPIHAAAIVQLDSASDQAGDVVWTSREKCLRGSNPERACPLFRELPEGTMAKGCAGAFYTNQKQSLFELSSPTEGGCQRYELAFSPDAMCTGDFNGDNALDLAIAADDESRVFVMNGDGFGGLLDPPDEFVLPGGATGGPIACGRIDGDNKDDLVVVSRATGDAYVLRTSP